MRKAKIISLVMMIVMIIVSFYPWAIVGEAKTGQHMGADGVNALNSGGGYS